MATQFSAQWSGSSWLPIASGLGGPVYSLTAYDDDLIAGGLFNGAPGIGPLGRVACWGLNQADSDSDGVPDVCDRCSNTVPGAVVDANGCPPRILVDYDRDGDVDAADFTSFAACVSGPSVPMIPGCYEEWDFDQDGDVDQTDFAVFQRCYSGSGNPADPHCAD